MNSKEKSILRAWDLAMPLILKELHAPPHEEAEIYELMATRHVLSEEDVEDMADENNE